MRTGGEMDGHDEANKYSLFANFVNIPKEWHKICTLPYAKTDDSQTSCFRNPVIRMRTCSFLQQTDTILWMKHPIVIRKTDKRVLL
jgi:hypothetical protein